MPALSKYLSEKKQRKNDTLDARLYEIIVNLIAQQGTSILSNQTIWQAVKDNIDGNSDPCKPLSYETEEFYTLSQKKINDILESKFCAKKIRIGHDGIRGMQFNQDVLNRLEPNYAKSEDIRIIENADALYGSDGSGEQASANTDTSEGVNYNNNQENIDINGINKYEVTENGNNIMVEKSENADTYGENVSDPSALSANKYLPQSSGISRNIDESPCEECGQRVVANPFYRKIHRCETKCKLSIKAIMMTADNNVDEDFSKEWYN